MQSSLIGLMALWLLGATACHCCGPHSLDPAKQLSLSLDVKSQDASQQGAPPLSILTSDPKHTSPVSRFAFSPPDSQRRSPRARTEVLNYGVEASPPTHPPLLLHGIIGWTPAEGADGIGIDPIRSYAHVYLLDCGLFRIDWTGSGRDVREQDNR